MYALFLALFCPFMRLSTFLSAISHISPVFSHQGMTSNTASEKTDSKHVKTHINPIQHAMRAFDLLSAMASQLVHRLQPV
jgi:hypothetical protein